MHVPQQQRRARMRPWCAVGIAAAVALTSHPALADDEPEPYVARRLGGHRFVPSTVVDWGFIDSSFTSTTFAGLSEFGFTPGDRIARIIGTQETKVAVVSQSFAGSAALTRWLGATLRVSALGVVPYDAVAGVVVGAHEVYRAEASILLGLLRLDRVQLTARGALGWGETRSTIPARLPERPFVEGDVGTIRPSLVADVALAPWLGLQASGSYAWRQFDILQEDDVQTLQGAVALTLSLPRIPATILAGFEISHDFNRDIASATSLALFGSSATRERAELGIYYQGRRELDLGASFAYEGDSDADEKRASIVVHMGYYF